MPLTCSTPSVSPAQTTVRFVGRPPGLAAGTVGDALAAAYDVNLAGRSPAAAILEDQASRWTAESMQPMAACTSRRRRSTAVSACASAS